MSEGCRLTALHSTPGQRAGLDLDHDGRRCLPGLPPAVGDLRLADAVEPRSIRIIWCVVHVAADDEIRLVDSYPARDRPVAQITLAAPAGPTAEWWRVVDPDFHPAIAAAALRRQPLSHPGALRISLPPWKREDTHGLAFVAPRGRPPAPARTGLPTIPRCARRRPRLPNRDSQNTRPSVCRGRY